ncbi:N-acetylmuramoyl-L-alanine amidase [Brevibacterium sp. 50QC2O2]|uniref:N-acetylmuramoyl-L-alanine amidase n=1 Tax=Brevibacterium sp. 50QC2O2 TaxID=2968459 RepID=UPI00211B8593|nr:N-acetylmuramoyl-L-alanine amidase [Brevibacterium sp. 50QC2O2]MCQ9388371.1 N-acetylmuramoyl-L-alanine amidase [Brevibacterium sp. 50QC2O2]
MRRLITSAALMALVLTASACSPTGTSSEPTASPSSSGTGLIGPSARTGSAPTAVPGPNDSELTAAQREVLNQATVALDPGHNGGNAKHPARANAPVPDGRGGTKPCNTTGTATDAGYSEHRFNWQVAQLVRTQLRDAGATVKLSRKNDTGVGPCVDRRGRFADGADVLVSVHANGSDSTRTKGFHVIASPSGKNAKANRRLATSMVKALKAQGFTPNRAYGKDAVSIRTDLAGLENARVPAVIVECAEMRNPQEAKTMTTAAGRLRYAHALTAGTAEFLADR